jgi:hypothetical protein
MPMPHPSQTTPRTKPDRIPRFHLEKTPNPMTLHDMKIRLIDSYELPEDILKAREAERQAAREEARRTFEAKSPEQREKEISDIIEWAQSPPSSPSETKQS